MPYTKEESVEILSTVYEKHEEISSASLEQEGVPTTAVYDVFDSLREAEMEVGGELEFECGECGRVFEDRQKYGYHVKRSSHTREKRMKRAREEIGNVECECLVYVLRIERAPDEKEFLYVGRTVNPYARLSEHFRGRTKMVQPTPDGILEKQNYSVVEVVETIPCSDSEHGREVERKTLLRKAIEHETTDVLGGK
ncbi:GIY-YIG nuclease [Halovirus HCTV-5]|uniref:GIY-YIG nuclease n=1 Tax=Halovirus HCTV-5 TaxID=1273748 RepID=UPI000334837E|nr:GIY-YIG nuclease [Halovirus HCTV-5]AGM11768.1 GIY-YIG nuclease [Halovirus HCTV-5]